MFAETARQTVACIGKEALAKGVITFEELPAAIARIEAAIAAAKAEPKAGEDDDAPPQISQVQRLVPFLELLQRTLGDEGYVVWEAAADFGPTA
jgi:hypothetical protein